ncbi:hypothetical protein ES332_A13G193100v1 [Gossypium tomentosum]|uniref:Uncharacterized protein n=1 Tax=Gossypium tomentosum TaxID=34277 RepID=A0A5D2MM57_GOSTO|nr:hypothetical protein ES332_A13G193100v1 [Gossypium tomentosum]
MPFFVSLFFTFFFLPILCKMLLIVLSFSSLYQLVIQLIASSSQLLQTHTSWSNRAIGVLEGIALVGNPDIAIVDEAYPYIAQRLLTDEFPRLRNALRNTIYGKSGVFDAERFIDVMQAFENFIIATKSGGGENLNGDMAELGLLQRQVDISFPRFLSSES